MPVFKSPPVELQEELPDGFRLAGPQGKWKEYVVYRHDVAIGSIVRMGKGWQCHSAALKPWKNPVGWKKSVSESALLLAETMDAAQPMH